MKFVQPPFKGENKGHYTPGIISKGMLYVSGQLSIDPDTREVCRGDIRAHARLALGNVDRVLKEAAVSSPRRASTGARSTRSTPNSSARTSPAASSPPCPSCTSAASSRSRPWPSSTRTDPHLFFWETAT